MRKGAWRHAVRLAPAYAAGWSLRRRVRRELDRLMQGPGQVLREAMSHDGPGPLVLFACFHDFRQRIEYDLAFGAALAAQGANVAVFGSRGLLARAPLLDVRGEGGRRPRAADPGASGSRPQLAGEAHDRRAAGSSTCAIGACRSAAGRSRRPSRGCASRYSELQEPGARRRRRRARSTSRMPPPMPRTRRSTGSVRRRWCSSRRGTAPPASCSKRRSSGKSTSCSTCTATRPTVCWSNASVRTTASSTRPSRRRRCGPASGRGRPTRTAPARFAGASARPMASGESFNRKYGQAGKRLRSRDELTRELGLDPSRPTAVISATSDGTRRFSTGRTCLPTTTSGSPKRFARRRRFPV